MSHWNKKEWNIVYQFIVNLKNTKVKKAIKYVSNSNKSFYQFMRVDRSFVNADRAPAAEVGLKLGLVVDQAALLQNDVPILPTVDVIRPFTQRPCKHG